MSSLVKAETPWQWAKKRRKIFTSPVKDFLSAVIVGVATGVYRYRAGDPNWRIAVTASVIAVAAAFILPQLETLFWLVVRKWVLFDETQAELEALRVRVGEGDARTRSAAEVEDLLRRLGNLRLQYIELERAFLAQGGREALWHAQTALHNDALKIIDSELGRDYWAQFKDVRQAPLVVPSGFPSDDAQRLNLLYMIHGRSEWLSKILDGIRSGKVVPKPVPVEATPPESQRLKDMRSVLLEAAEYLRAQPRGLISTRDAAMGAILVHQTVPELLTRGFVVPSMPDYNAYLEGEKQKRGQDFNPCDASADFLARLAGQLREDNLDQGFLMPASWLQFRESDPAGNWPANTRQVSGTATRPE